jgi:hypothetical protein
MRAPTFLPVVAWTTAACVACGATTGASVTPSVPSSPLVGAHGQRLDARALVADAPFTAFVFFSPDCHCLERHEPRLFDLYGAYHPRGVDFVMIDSEVRGSVERDADEARKRRYPFPILRDPGASLANALGAQYATYTVIVDPSGRVRYRGGIDTDRQHLHDDATLYVKDALDDLLAGREPRTAYGEALGCTLQTW